MSQFSVAVIYGGPSQEHEVSIKTGQAMLEGLDPAKYKAIPVFISKDGTWQISDGEFINQDEAIERLKDIVDVCLIGLHGTFGEDGQIQELFEASSIPYTGSDTHASKLAMEKHRTSQYYQKAGLQTPQELAVSSWSDGLATTAVEKLVLPIVVKPESQGSSVGVSIVEDESNLRQAVEDALSKDDVVILQQYIKGREVSCGVLDINGKLQALPPTEVEPLSSQFYDYDAKYVVGATKETTPPENMDKTVISQVQDIAIRAHQALGCSGYSRTDIIIDKDTPYVIETNTLPGMTITSFLPQQVAAIGMEFSELLDHIIEAALRK